MSNIHGVRIIPKRKIIDERGAIFHMLREDDPEFQRFGEIYFSKVHPGIVKGWHIHSQMTLNYLVVVGSIRLVLFDDREASPTRGMHQQIVMTDSDSPLVIVPPFVWNGFKGLGSGDSIVANCSTVPHHPTEISRRPYDEAYFRYDWEKAVVLNP